VSTYCAKDPRLRIAQPNTNPAGCSLDRTPDAVIPMWCLTAFASPQALDIGVAYHDRGRYMTIDAM
jgi:hypothetical protein